LTNDQVGCLPVRQGGVEFEHTVVVGVGNEQVAVSIYCHVPWGTQKSTPSYTRCTVEARLSNQETGTHAGGKGRFELEHAVTVSVRNEQVAIPIQCEVIRIAETARVRFAAFLVDREIGLTQHHARGLTSGEILSARPDQHTVIVPIGDKQPSTPIVDGYAHRVAELLAVGQPWIITGRTGVVGLAQYDDSACIANAQGLWRGSGRKRRGGGAVPAACDKDACQHKNQQIAGDASRFQGKIPFLWLS
jgi:hypothetical protein